MEKREQLYEGKAKRVFRTSEPDVYWVEYKDDATAFNGEKKGQIAGKGELNNRISSIFFTMLKERGIDNHFIRTLSATEQLVRQVRIIPIEVVVRNIAAGSLAKRLGFAEGTALKQPVVEFYYKNDELGDPLINNSHARVLGIADDADLTVEQMFASRFETFSELERLMIDYCQQICNYVGGQKDSKNRGLLEQVRNFVLEHYTDPSIGLESIADEFGFSASYLTRYFKNQTGQSLKHYIDQVRMEKAKELLIHSDKTLGEIVQTVGYVDATNFIRKFKKLEGITPIQYRTIVQSDPLPISK